MRRRANGKYLGEDDAYHKKERDDNENRTRRYPPEPNLNLTGKTRCDWVRVLPEFKFRVRV
ncbi:hypothetical protein Lal_00039501 [Lupinus albus]|nr:hypothetical protein Lal_00039501 [Lupinus albus]